MASEFWALRVGSGESFLLRTFHDNRPFVVLVDGGRSSKKVGRRHRLVEAIQTACPGLKSIDVVICTHQDSDHAGGLESFADHWFATGRDIGEYWLPGTWAAVFPNLLTNVPTFLNQLSQGAQEAAERILGGKVEPLQLARYLRDQLDRERDDMQDREPQTRDRAALSEYGLWGEEVSIWVEEDTASERILRNAGKFGPSQPWPLYLFESTSNIAVRSALLADAIEAAVSIRRIAVSAIRNRIRVRWFDFSLFEKGYPPRGGVSDLLLPLNAVELTRPPSVPSDLYLFAKLYLSRQNVESLVFERVETPEEPGAYFLGDSRLAFGELKPERDFPRPAYTAQRPSIVTAPHHGSQTDDHAYDVLTDWGVRPLLVRNGGHWKSKIGDYRSHGERRCANCRNCPRKISQVVLVHTKGADWDWENVSGEMCPE